MGANYTRGILFSSRVEKLNRLFTVSGRSHTFLIPVRPINIENVGSFTQLCSALNYMGRTLNLKPPCIIFIYFQHFDCSFKSFYTLRNEHSKEDFSIKRAAGSWKNESRFISLPSSYIEPPVYFKIFEFLRTLGFQMVLGS